MTKDLTKVFNDEFYSKPHIGKFMKPKKIIFNHNNETWGIDIADMID